jgi:hypothetical protein
MAILEGSAIAVSDGLFKSSFGTFSWIITTPDEHAKLEGVGIVPGKPEFQSAYRSELCGLLAILSVLQELVKRYGLGDFATAHHPHITIACDGESAVKQAAKTRQDLKMDEKQADLLGTIRKMTRDIPVTITFRHVDGHQDDHADKSDVWGRLNVRMDERAKAHWRVTQGTRPHFQRLQAEPWALLIGDRKISCNIKEAITEHIHGLPCKEYWLKRGKVGTLEGIAWECVERALKQQSLSRQREITKHAT